MESKKAVGALTALAQESRLAVFRLLVQLGPDGLPASDVAARLGITASTLSFHLKTLSHAGLVSARQQGRFIYYAAEYAAMNDLLGFLTENCCQGSSCKPVRAARGRSSRRRRA
jgi:DNA-binding transcriptional ArsR family regulator